MMPSPAASKVATHFLQFRIQYSSIALLYYDYVLTFPSEIKYMWGQKFRFSTSLYIFCRYAMVANVLYVLAVTGKFHSRYNKSIFCDAVYKFDGALSVLGRAAVIATLTARAYAVFGCSRIILILLGALGVACIVLDIMHVPGLRCVGSSSDYLGWLPALIRTASLLLAILMRVFELLAALLTTVRSLLEFRVGRTWKLERGSFVVVLFKQGVIYIIFSTAISIIAVLFQYRAPSGSLFQRLLNALSLPLSCLLTARFLLQLREWQGKGSVLSTRHDNGGIYTQQAETLSALRAAGPFDAAVLDDFGDGDGEYALHLYSDSEPETTRTAESGAIEMEHRPKDTS